MQIQLQERPAEPMAANPRQEGPAGVLILPGLDDSGPGHWQSHWQILSNFSRVDFASWSSPLLHEWVARLDAAIRQAPHPVVLAAHSLGCLAALWWAGLCRTGESMDKVRGALLVAPPDVDTLDCEARLRDFRPLPRRRLPFPTILVASRDDPFARFERSAEMARSWGSELVDAGETGHINADSAIHEWSGGLRHLARLSGHSPNLLVSELGLRTALN
jgi:predicted alpha/beta hydrolase family esterase